MNVSNVVFGDLAALNSLVIKFFRVRSLGEFKFGRLTLAPAVLEFLDEEPVNFHLFDTAHFKTETHFLIASRVLGAVLNFDARESGQSRVACRVDENICLNFA